MIFFRLAIILLFAGNLASAQVSRLCDTYMKNKEAEDKIPGISEKKAELEKFTNNYSKRTDKGDEVYIIPTVFHVVHDNGSENISKEQIENAILWMNLDFRKMCEDSSDIISEFKSIAADSRIEFRLARLDPDGNCTDGVVRVQSFLTYSANEDVKDIAPAWPRDKYLNIWVVKSVGSGAAGYSYYPATVDNEWGMTRDGILLRHNYVGAIGTSSMSHARVLTHEAGHYLNLMHPWGNSNDPELSGNCEIDDEVEDTPNTIGHTTCNLNAVTCGSLDNVQNHMEYSYCTKMFTYGQKDRMRATMNSTISGRVNLWQESNLIATGVIDEPAPAICVPVADLSCDSTEGCEGITIQFTDRSYNSDLDSTWTWAWEFEGGEPAVSTEQNPEITYFTAGWFNVTLTVSNSAGNDNVVYNDRIHILSDSSGYFAPYLESFENSLFPEHPSDENKKWTVISQGYENWIRTDMAAYSGNYSMMLDNRNNWEGTQNILITPAINISELTDNVRLFFRLAYAKSGPDSYDKFIVYSSDDCGISWHIEMVKTASSLVSNGGDYVYSTFIPENSEWNEFEVDMDNYLGAQAIRLKFVCESHNGNILYIDDIHFNNLSPVEEVLNPSTIFVYPNPAQNILTIQYNDLNTIELVDITGQVIISETYSGTTNKAEIDVSIFDKGIYFIRINREISTKVAID
ncbi:MAG: hypothetical protein A2W91_14260 [Bacteroidetes bacterium GWF2_38_335]|nr:MAG: hypothetical protein A2W91_14260 [Bacteroidetes bacterium GWF2_38_335]OFY79374.1 MAG: hypothetical protein A2281_16895 [Bacteroidetes bacterium RIFOXYA12_FULL_38_20]HBS85637.1 hypothetical protein [Bacteroidales bacterium]